MQDVTYCDNYTLLEAMVGARPAKCGLFAHEIAVLAQVARGGGTTGPFFGDGTLRFRYNVLSPNLCAASLAERGFLSLCSDEEQIDFIKIKEAREILKRYGIKPGTSRKVAMKRLIENFSPSEIAAELPYRYYRLTTSGDVALRENSKELDSDGYKDFIIDVRPDESRRPLTRKELSDEVDRITNEGYILRISKQGQTVSFANYPNEALCPLAIYEFERPSRLRVEAYGNVRLFDNAKCCMPLLKTNRLIVGKKDNDVREDRLTYEVVDLHGDEALPTIGKQTLAKPSIVWSEASAPHYAGLKNTIGLSGDFGIRVYCSSTGAISDAVAEHILPKLGAKVSIIPNLLDNDGTENLSLTIPTDSDMADIRYMLYLGGNRFSQNLFSHPQLRGIPIDALAQGIYARSRGIVKWLSLFDTDLLLLPKVLA